MSRASSDASGVRPWLTNATRTRVVRLIAYACAAGVLYVAFALGALLLSMVLLGRGSTPAQPLIREIQQALYMGGMRRIWQVEPGCTAYDPDLLYVPGPDPCRFANTEFRTTLHFDRLGRLMASRPAGAGIAVLGDSHAMGWGVEDHETFASHLQSQLGRPVYNLAVSSYGTYRELLRLERSGLLDQVDTVLIQYSDNDILENETMAADPSRASTPEEYQDMFSAAKAGRATVLLAWVQIAVKKPIKLLVRAVVPLDDAGDFAPHGRALARVFERFPWLQKERVLVFYVNAYGVKFRGFGADPLDGWPSLTFADLKMEPEDFYAVDEHMTAAGHRRAAEKLALILKN